MALDIANQAYKAKLKPILYDGNTMPFEDNQFDTALVMTVLHHAQDPEQVLREAQRVARTVIVMEDIYTNRIQQKLTHWTDSLTNWEFAGHPHNNRTSQRWLKTFRDLGFSIADQKSFAFLAVYRQEIYVLRS